ncbi:MAG: SAM-dependent methyltransferase [Marinifilaceae bacterium]
MGKIYLLPNLLGENTLNAVIPQDVQQIIKSIKIFATENIKNTRRYLKLIDKQINIDELVFLELNEHSNFKDIQEYITYIEKGDIGIISEAGCPGIADPGAELVALAHQKNIEVIPLVGPSSILLALIASGCNGQNFAFNGYLPVKSPERGKAIKSFEKRSKTERRAEIFIETPYRNQKLLEELCVTLQLDTRLTVACDITTPTAYIKTKAIKEWKKEKIDIHKRPAIFIIQG